MAALVELAHRPAPEPRPSEAIAGPVRPGTSRADTDDERENVEKLRDTMDVVLRVPVVERAAVMPDACPSGPVGTIPVGGVVAARNAILPGMHSADICCSLMATVIDGATPEAVLEAMHAATHFGPGGRPTRSARPALPEPLAGRSTRCPTRGCRTSRATHMGTQGDGNHFAFVGRLESSGKTALVTHHGSRGLGARVFKAGMRIAEAYRREAVADTPKQNAWIPYGQRRGTQPTGTRCRLVRAWTKRNHETLHEAVLEAVGGRVSLRSLERAQLRVPRGGRAGAACSGTPRARPRSTTPLLPDTDGVQIVPLNMAEPVLFVRGARNARNLGFAPHGAGRNMSRTKHKKRLAGRSDADVFAEETAGLDVRFWCGRTDVSELPSAYKDAASVQADMARFELAEVVDRVLPHGSIMAGDWERDAPWKIRKREKLAARAASAGPDGHQENAR